MACHDCNTHASVLDGLQCMLAIHACSTCSLIQSLSSTEAPATHLHAALVHDLDVASNACVLVHDAVLDDCACTHPQGHTPLCQHLLALLFTLIVVSTDDQGVLRTYKQRQTQQMSAPREEAWGRGRLIKKRGRLTEGGREAGKVPCLHSSQHH